MDNILIAFEIHHYLKRKTKGTKGFKALKTDMSKTYDIIGLSWKVSLLNWAFVINGCTPLGTTFPRFITESHIIYAEGLSATFITKVAAGLLHCIFYTCSNGVTTFLYI